MTNNTIPHDHHHHHHRLRPHHQEMGQLQALAVTKPQVKKKARRRTHTSRPYQERLLNMAEARREIVTALKIHRASTSTRQHQQQSTYQQHHQEPPLQQLQQQQEQQQQQVQVMSVSQDPRQAAAVDEEAYLVHTTSTMSYAAATFANNPLCSSRAAHWIAAGSSYCSPPPPILRLPCDLVTPPELPIPPTAAAAMGGLVELDHYQGDLERLVRSLPAQPLGLNLSFQGFGVAVEDGAKDDCEDLLLGSLPLTQQPSPAASYSYSPPLVETATTHACGGHGSPSPALSATDAENEKHSVIDAPPAAAALVPMLLDGGTEMMAQEASTGGEMLQGVEWSEAPAADVAAWWSKIFESGQRAPPNAEEDVAAGLPAEWRWLCGDDVGAAEQEAVTGGVLATVMHVDNGEDVTLPCMDGIGDDVQAWDGEWFSCS